MVMEIGDEVETIDGYKGRLVRIDKIGENESNFVIEEIKTKFLMVFPERYIISKLRIQCNLKLKNLIESEIE